MKQKTISITKDGDKVTVEANGFDPKEFFETLKGLVDRIPCDLESIIGSDDMDDDEIAEKHGVSQEHISDLKKKAPDFPTFDEAYTAYKKGRSTTEEAMDKYDLEHGTIPDSVGKILSIVGTDEQIRNDMAKLVAGFCTNEFIMSKESKKKKKK